MFFGGQNCMDARENIDEALRRAVDHERELWAKCRGKLPGDPNCPEELWCEWRKSAELVRVLATERMRMMRPPER